jgi:CHRD domain
MKRLTMIMAVLLLIGSSVAFSDGFKNIRESLSGLKEVPVISTVGHGSFHARINNEGTEIEYVLTYADLEGLVQQSHIHFGPPNNTGGISVFLCSNLGNGPAGTQLCPLPPATVTGTITAADVIGPVPQGIEAGALEELITAIRDGKTYVNVHSTKWPAGEIRAQITHDNSGHNDH